MLAAAGSTNQRGGSEKRGDKNVQGEDTKGYSTDLQPPPPDSLNSLVVFAAAS